MEIITKYKGKVMTTSKRIDDVFLRRIIWLLLATSISSAGGWIRSIVAIESRIDVIESKMSKVEDLQKTMVSIDKGVGVLIEKVGAKNKLLETLTAQQRVIFGELKSYSVPINFVRRIMEQGALK